MIEFLWLQKANKDNLGRYYPVLTLASWCEQLTHWKSPWFWVRLKAEGKEGNRGWDGWMASPIQWPSTWANSRWWGTEKPGMLQSMGPQRVGHDLAPERQQGCMSSISLWFWFACFQWLTVLVIFSDGLLVHHNSSNKCQYLSSAYYVSGTVLSSEEIGEQWKKGTWILHFSGEKEIINMLHVMIKIWKRKWRVMWKLRQAGVTRQGNQGRPV